MTIDIDAIRQREQAATPGPWKLITDSCDCGGEYGCSHGTYPFALRLPEHNVSDRDRPCDPNDSLDHYRHTASEIGDLTMGSAEFIAHARTDIPALLAKVAELTAERDDLANLLDQTSQARDRFRAERDAERDAARADAANALRALDTARPVIEAAKAWAELCDSSGFDGKTARQVEDTLYAAVDALPKTEVAS